MSKYAGLTEFDCTVQRIIGIEFEDVDCTAWLEFEPAYDGGCYEESWSASATLHVVEYDGTDVYDLISVENEEKIVAAFLKAQACTQ